jgi:hypothetical protein
MVAFGLVVQGIDQRTGPVPTARALCPEIPAGVVVEAEPVVR